MLQQEFRKDNVGAVTVGLVKDGQLVWTKGYGFLDVNRTQPATADTVYSIGSVSKIFVGIMLLQMVQQGRVHLADPVIKYFPEISLVPTKYPWAPPITLIQFGHDELRTAGQSVGTIRTPLGRPRNGASSWWPLSRIRITHTSREPAGSTQM